MKTVITKTIDANIQSLTFGYWDNETEEFVPVDESTKIEVVAAYLGCTKELVYALWTFAEGIRDLLVDDLVDIWQRLDRIEE